MNRKGGAIVVLPKEIRVEDDGTIERDAGPVFAPVHYVVRSSELNGGYGREGGRERRGGGGVEEILNTGMHSHRKSK